MTEEKTTSLTPSCDTDPLTMGDATVSPTPDCEADATDIPHTVVDATTAAVTPIRLNGAHEDAPPIPPLTSERKLLLDWFMRPLPRT